MSPASHEAFITVLLHQLWDTEKVGGHGTGAIRSWSPWLPHGDREAEPEPSWSR